MGNQLEPDSISTVMSLQCFYYRIFVSGRFFIPCSRFNVLTIIFSSQFHAFYPLFFYLHCYFLVQFIVRDKFHSKCSVLLTTNAFLHNHTNYIPNSWFISIHHFTFRFWSFENPFSYKPSQVNSLRINLIPKPTLQNLFWNNSISSIPFH